MKITAISSHVRTAIRSAPNPEAGHHQPTPLMEIPGYSQASLGHLLWSHCSFILGPGAYKVLLVPSKSLFPQSCISSGSSMIRLMATSCKSPMHALLHSVSPTLQQATADPCLWPETPGHSRASLGLFLVGPLNEAVHAWNLLKEATIIIVWPQVK